MTTNKALLIGGGITILGVVGFIVFKKIKKKKELAQMMSGNTSAGTTNTGGGNTGGGNTNTGGGNTNTGGASSYNSFNDRKILADAMSVWTGTDESAVNGVIARTTQAQRDKIRTDWDANVGMYKGDTLKAWIEGDYSFSEEKRILKAFGY